MAEWMYNCFSGLALNGFDFYILKGTSLVKSPEYSLVHNDSETYD
jgi:hypothetical protein